MALPPASRASSGTLAGVLEVIKSIPDLSPQRRQNMASSVRTVSRMLGRPVESIPAEPRLLARSLSDLAPEAAGISRARWNNVRSLLRGALELTRPMLPGRQTQPLSAPWQALYENLTGIHRQRRLSRLLRYFSGLGIEPQTVTPSH